MRTIRQTRLGHEATARLLLDKGADVAAADNDGATALIRASLNGHEGGGRGGQFSSSAHARGVSDPTVHS